MLQRKLIENYGGISLDEQKIARPSLKFQALR